MNEENISQSFKMSYILHKPWADILFETTLPPMILEKILPTKMVVPIGSGSICVRPKTMESANNII